MAIFTSGKGCFEVISLSFAPDIITLGEETAFSIRIKNVSGKKIGSLYLRGMLYYRSQDGHVRPCNDVFFFGGPSFAMKGISWANGATKTFEGRITFTPPAYYPPDMSARLLPLFSMEDIGASGGDTRLGLRLLFATDVIFADGTNTDNIYDLRGADSEYLRIIDAHYSPAVTAFSAERCTLGTPDDEGENILLSAALALGTTAKAENMSLQLSYRDKANPNAAPATVDLTNLVPAALIRETQALVSEILDKNADWDLSLRFGDPYEAAEMPLTLSRAFANMHLSGASTGGVCLGSFSRATEGKPLFQCCYPAEFEYGIRGVSNYAAGETDTGGRWYEPGEAWNQGRKIYRYIWRGTTAISGGQGVVTILPCVPDMVISLRGMLRHRNEAWLPIPFAYHGGPEYSAYVRADANGNVLVGLGSAYSGTNELIIIAEYTKLEEAGT